MRAEENSAQAQDALPHVEGSESGNCWILPCRTLPSRTSVISRCLFFPQEVLDLGETGHTRLPCRGSLDLSPIILTLPPMRKVIGSERGM